MTINERFETIIKILFGGNKRAFAKAVGISPTVVENVVGTRKGKPSYDVLVKVCANTNISAEWLLLGSEENLMTEIFNIRKDLTLSVSPEEAEEGGGMPLKTVFTKGKKTTTKKPTTISETVYKAPEGSSEGIPLIPIDAMAGALTDERTVLEYECERYVVPAFKGADFLIPVKGSSMYPKYSSGDIVACQRVPMSDLFFQWNKVYVIDTNQGALIKRIKPGSDKDHVLIVSDNEKYDPFELPYSAIHAVALVIGVIRLE